MIGASLTILVAATGDPASRLNIEATIESDVDPIPSALYLEAEIDGSAGEMATDHTVATQAIGWAVTKDGVPVSPHVLDNIEVGMDIDQHLRSWAMDIILDTPDGQLGNPIYEPGPGTCLDEIDISMVFRTATGFHYIPFIIAGIGDASDRSTSPSPREKFTGVDRGGRYDGKTIDLILPPGHGLSRRRVVQIAATRTGIPSSQIDLQLHPGHDVDRPMMKEFQISDGQFLGPCQTLVDTDQMRLGWNREGNFSWVRAGRPGDDEDTIDHLDERYFMTASVNVHTPGGETITYVVVNAEEQKTRGPEDCGDVTTPLEIETKGFQGPIAPDYVQDGAGGNDPNPYDSITFPNPQRTRLEVIERTKRCGVDVYTRRIAYSYFLPRAGRYVWDQANEEWDQAWSAAVDEATDGNAAAYMGLIEKWARVEVDEEWQLWNDPEFVGGLYKIGRAHV